jgi:hypothetical protein
LIGALMALLHALKTVACNTSYELNILYIYRYFMKFEGKLDLIKTMNVNVPVRAISWNHLKPNMVAAGLFSGDIIIIDVEKYTIA